MVYSGNLLLSNDVENKFSHIPLKYIQVTYIQCDASPIFAGQLGVFWESFLRITRFFRENQKSTRWS